MQRLPYGQQRGRLRNPGAITANYDYVSGGKTYAKASHVYPDLAGSNVCMACHTARESGDTVRGLNDPALLSSQTISVFNFSNIGFINSHYLSAGGQVFTATGYEFPGRPYNNIPEYLHDKIGTAATQQASTLCEYGLERSLHRLPHVPSEQEREPSVPAGVPEHDLDRTDHRHRKRGLLQMPRTIHDAHPRPRKRAEGPVCRVA